MVLLHRVVLFHETEAGGSREFTPLWTGQAGPLGRHMAAGELTRRLADEALERLHALQC